MSALRSPGRPPGHDPLRSGPRVTAERTAWIAAPWTLRLHGPTAVTPLCAVVAVGATQPRRRSLIRIAR